tara:strand:+ start:132 stop:656 length:525 start_codon:yes stop_codon:yes gene_type:complete
MEDSMSEEKQAVTETVSESSAKETPQVSSNDEYIAESKKYRKRAQDAEARLAQLERSLAKAEEDKLKEKEDFKTLYEQASSKIENLTQTANKWNEYEGTRRTSLLEKHPEEDRERLSSLDLDTLEYVTNKIQNVKPNAPEAIGRSKASIPNKKWADMNEEERRAYYADQANRRN